MSGKGPCRGPPWYSLAEFIPIPIADRRKKCLTPTIKADNATGGVFGGRFDTNGVEIKVVRMAKEMAKALHFADIPYCIGRQKGGANTLQVERHAFDQGVVIPSRLFQMIFKRFAESF